MDFGGTNGDQIDMWQWRGGEYELQRDSLDDMSNCLWGGVNQNVDELLNMLDEQTPIKDCAELSHQDNSDLNDKCNETLEEFLESSQLKRRRMLQFTPENDEAMECAIMEEGLSEHLEWNNQWNYDFSEENCALNCEGLDQLSEEWLVDCLTEGETHCNSCEMNMSMAYSDHAGASQYYNNSLEIEGEMVQENPKPACAMKLPKGRKSVIKASTKLNTSVAYPFALIKPCGAHGDTTLNEINQKILAPPRSKLKHKVEGGSVSYAMSPFSGKPVVVRTKIRTEGGKGSITIMRTRG